MRLKIRAAKLPGFGERNFIKDLSEGHSSGKKTYKNTGRLRAGT